MKLSSKFKSLNYLSTLVKNNTSIGIGGHHFARLPIALINSLLNKNPKNLEHITNVFFNQRRKMIKKPLSLLFKNTSEISKKVNININDIHIFELCVTLHRRMNSEFIIRKRRPKYLRDDSGLKEVIRNTFV